MNLYKNPHQVHFLLFLVILSFIVLGWLNPLYWPDQVDLVWLLSGWIFSTFIYTAYFFAELHRGGYPVLYDRGHSSTKNGDWAKEFPAQEDWPEMVGIPLEGGNFLGFGPIGGRRGGWLVVPREHVFKLNKGMLVVTKTKVIRPEGLPPHIYNDIKDHPLFSDRGAIRLGIWPILKNLPDVLRKLKATDITSCIERISSENAELRKTIDSLNEDIAQLRESKEELAESYRTISRETRTEAFKRMMGGEDNE